MKVNVILDSHEVGTNILEWAVTPLDYGLLLTFFHDTFKPEVTPGGNKTIYLKKGINGKADFSHTAITQVTWETDTADEAQYTAMMLPIANQDNYCTQVLLTKSLPYVIEPSKATPPEPETVPEAKVPDVEPTPTPAPIPAKKAKSKKPKAPVIEDALVEDTAVLEGAKKLVKERTTPAKKSTTPTPTKTISSESFL